MIELTPLMRGLAPEVGSLSIVLAFGTAIYGAVASIAGARTGGEELVESGRRALLAVAACATLAVLALLTSIIARDFSVAYVWETSSLSTPLAYIPTTLWGGQSGSLLFWSWLLALLCSAAILGRWRADSALLPWFTGVCAAIVAFFLFLVAFVASPFDRLPVVPSDGNGLNPLLLHPGMAFHPPALYLGFTGMTIPYAFAMAALLTRRTDSGWILASRRWLLAAWLFLSIGLFLGARWAYDVLGWGGYWGWDPVENAALMPWLAATAFLHSVMVQERRNAFRIWNMTLIILTFGLVILGTFLTRAGLMTSVHSFAQSAIGPYFLVFTAAVILGSLVLLVTRLDELQSDVVLETPVSREGTFLLNNVLFMGSLFAVFWGTIFPLVSEVVTDERVTVGPPYFNRVVLPILWLTLLAMAAAPLFGWQRTDLRRVYHGLRGSLFVALLASAALYALGFRNWVALLGTGSALFALLVTGRELLRGVRARTARGENALAALGQLLRRNRRRYGGYIVHIGIALLALGIVVSGVYRVETEAQLAPGDSATCGAFELHYSGLHYSEEPGRASVSAVIEVSRAGDRLGRLSPRRDFHSAGEGQQVTVPAVLHQWSTDLYTVLGAFDAETEQVTLKAYLNPLMSAVWGGMIVLVLGTVVAAWPDSQEQRVMDAELRRLTRDAREGGSGQVVR